MTQNNCWQNILIFKLSNASLRFILYGCIYSKKYIEYIKARFECPQPVSRKTRKAILWLANNNKFPNSNPNLGVHYFRFHRHPIQLKSSLIKGRTWIIRTWRTEFSTCIRRHLSTKQLSTLISRSNLSSTTQNLKVSSDDRGLGHKSYLPHFSGISFHFIAVSPLFTRTWGMLAINRCAQTYLTFTNTSQIGFLGVTGRYYEFCLLIAPARWQLVTTEDFVGDHYSRFCRIRSNAAAHDH